MSMSVQEFEALRNQSDDELLRLGLRQGPCYQHKQYQPTVWFGEFFDKEITPAGEVLCRYPLRFGHTQSALEIGLIASNSVEEAVVFEAGATVTLTTLVGNDPKGTFVAKGGTICIVAPADGIKVSPNMLAYRFAIGNFEEQYLKVKLAFSGTITGGFLDCAVVYTAR